MNSFPDYDPSTNCPKCGYDDVSTHYVALGGSFSEPCFTAPKELARSEHLHRYCNRCSYTWCEACIPLDLLDDDEWNFVQAADYDSLQKKYDTAKEVQELLFNFITSIRETLHKTLPDKTDMLDIDRAVEVLSNEFILLRKMYQEEKGI